MGGLAPGLLVRVAGVRLRHGRSMQRTVAQLGYWLEWHREGGSVP